MSIHVLPIGLDSPERFLEGFKKYPPSKVIFMLGKEECEEELEARKIKDIVFKRLGDFVANEEIAVDVFDFAEVIKYLIKIIKENRGEVFINISSSTKIVTQAAYMATALFGGRLYYVPPKTYLSAQLQSILKTGDMRLIKKFISELKEAPLYLSSGAKSPIEIPVLKMEKPRREEFNVLDTLNVSGGNIKSIKRLLKQMKIQYTGSNINKYSKMVQSLERRGFVKTERVGRNTKIALTDSGKVIATLSDVL